MANPVQSVESLRLQTPGITSGAVEAALASLERFTTLVVIRVSEQALGALSNQEQTGRRVLGHLPAMQYVDGLPDDLLAQTASGERHRQEHGVVPIRRRDASPHADSPSSIMGYAVSAPPETLVLYIHDSAASPNVVVPGDHLPRVAFVELLVGLFACYESLTDAYHTDWKRMVRSDLQAQRLFDASRRFNVRQWVGGKLVDLASASGTLIANVEGHQASGERDAIRRRTTGGVLNALHSGTKSTAPAWPYAVRSMPLGYGVVLDGDGKVRTRSGVGGKGRWKLIAPDADEVAAVRRMLALVAEGRPWVDCAEPLVEARVKCRGKWAGKTYDQIPKGERGISVSNLVGRSEHRELWLTGTYAREKAVPVAHDGTLEGFAVSQRHGTFGVVEVAVDFGLPVGGFMDADTAQRIEHRLSARETKDGTRPGTCALLAYLPPYRDSSGETFTWERRLGRLGDGYVVWERPAADAVDSRGRARGWRYGDGRQLLTVRRRDLEENLAQRVEKAVRDVAAERLAVRLRDPGPDDEASRLGKRITELETEVGNALASGRAADRAAQVAAAAQTMDAAAVARHSSAATAYFEAAAALELQVGRLREKMRELGEQPSTRVMADLGTPAAVAGCLNAYAGHAVPLEVNQALRSIGLDSFRMDVDANNTSLVRWQLELQLPLVDGGTAVVPVAGVVLNRRRDPSAQRTAAEADAAVAVLFLRDGEALDDVARACGISRGETVTRLRNHLSRCGVRQRGLRGAIVDLPVEMKETRLALWSVVSGDLRASDHLRQLRAHLGAVYLGKMRHPNAWARSDCAVARRALRAMQDALPGSGQDGVSVEVLARVTGATRTQINRLCGDRAGRGATGARFAGILVRDELNPQIVRMRHCPHPDCPAPDGYRWLSFYLPVPETDGYNGLICPSCMRLPDLQLSTLCLPDSYVEHLWAGPANAANFDLAAGPATREVDAAAYRPSSRLPRRRRWYNLTEAADRLGITNSALRSWLRDPEDPLPSTRLSGPGGTKYAITQETLDHATEHPRAVHLRQQSPRPTAPAEDAISLQELARRTGVAEHYLRQRALQGFLGPVGYEQSPGGGAARMVVSRSVLNPVDPRQDTAALPADWLSAHRQDLLLIGEAARRAGVTVSILRTAIYTGDLPSRTTDGGTHRLDPADVDNWATERRQAGTLTPKQAAQRAGVTPDALRRATETGALRCSTTRGGHRRYRPQDIDAWESTRRPSKEAFRL